MKEWKAPEKEAQKMTRDGAVSVNLVTGETTYPSDREPEQDHSASGDTAGAAGKAVDRAELHREQAAAKKKLLGFTQNSPKETGRNSQTRIKRKSHYSKPFKSFILNSDQTTQ